MRKWLAILLALVFIGASAQCLADCATQVCKIPPCPRHSQHKCTESQLTAATPDSHPLPVTLVDPGEWLLQTSVVLDECSADFGLEFTASETPPPLTILRI